MPSNGVTVPCAIIVPFMCPPIVLARDPCRPLVLRRLLPPHVIAIKSGLNRSPFAGDQWRGKTRPEVRMQARPRPWRLPDARYFQIAALATLVAINFAIIDFGANPAASVIAVATALLMQALCCRI